MENREILRQGFVKLFPEQTPRLDALYIKYANASEKEVLQIEKEMELIQQEMLDEIVQKVRLSLIQSENSKGKSLKNEQDEGLAFQLKQELYNELIRASGDSIETKIVKLMDALQRLNNVDKSDAEAVLATIISGGFTSITVTGIMYLIKCLTAGDELLPAAFAAVQVCTPELIINAVNIVLIIILLPLIYFINKPAACILLVINELRQDLEFVDEYCIHGKKAVTTQKIPKICFKENTPFYSAGFFAAQKKSGALIGTQYGFTLKQSDIDKVTFNFGIGCPLAKGKNNCAVGCNQTSKSIAEDADKLQKQEDLFVMDEYEIDIKCHSSSGSVAYYIARVGYKN